MLALWSDEPPEARAKNFKGMLQNARGGDGGWSESLHAAAVRLARYSRFENAEAGPPRSQDGLHAVASARLDNRFELMRELALDAVDPSDDTGLILAAYRRWGRDCAARLLGDFAFVVWDAGERTLFAACDVMGVEPLYYARAAGAFLIGSEARPLTVHPAVSRDPSEEALLMWCLNCWDERFALFAGVRGLPRGHWLWVEAGGEPEVAAFWRPSQVEPLRYGRDADYAAHLRELLARCVADRCRGAGAHVGVAMSGGMDSTSVAAMAPKDLSRVAFSYRFEALKDCDESPLSQLAADFLGMSVHWLDCEAHPMIEFGPDPFGPRADPFQSWDSMHRRMIRRLASLGGRVLLTGHGGDNLMTGVGPAVLAAGSDHGEPPSLGRLWRVLRREPGSTARGLYRLWLAPRLPVSWRRRLRRCKLGRPNRWPWIDRRAYRAFRADGLFFDWPARQFDDLARQRVFEMADAHAAGVRRAVQWFRRMAAPFGVAVRHPFLDRRLVEFILAMPPRLIRLGDQPKGLLRQAMAGALPPPILARRDKPHLRSFYRHGVAGQVAQLEALTRHSELERRGLIDGVSMIKSVKAYLDGASQPAEAWFLAAALMEIWLKNDA